jgi:hypothetical protein
MQAHLGTTSMVAISSSSMGLLIGLLRLPQRTRALA